MHDTRLEDQLRVELRRAGDALPLTVTPAELERRLIARRRQRQGRRVSLIAAAVAVLSVVSIVAVGNGWILKPAVVVGTSPSPTTGPSGVTSSPSAPATSPSTLEPSPSAPGARRPIGLATDAVIVQAVAPQGETVGAQYQVSLVHEDMSVTPVDTVVAPVDVTVSEDHPMSVSSTGYLLIQLLDADDNPAGAMLYDLLDPSVPPRRFDDPSIVDFAWGPTGRLAMIGADQITVIDPADPSAPPQVVPYPQTVAIAVMPGRRSSWSADGLGLIADGQIGGDFLRGVLRLDGTFVVDPSPSVFAATGVERVDDPSGATIGPACDQVGTSGPNPCVIVSSGPGDSHARWYTEGTFGMPTDQLWSTTGKTILMVFDEHKDGAKTRTVRIVTGGPKNYSDVAVLGDMPLSRNLGQMVFAGMSPDDGQVVLDLGTGTGNTATLEIVDRVTGMSGTFQGRFIGWGDDTGFTYPGEPAP
jgi:hypothetical protein